MRAFFPRAYDIESHYFTQYGHPFDDRGVHVARLRHASKFILHEQHRLAHEGAFASFTLHSPDPDRMQLNEFVTEVGELRDVARTEGLTSTPPGIPFIPGASPSLQVFNPCSVFAHPLAPTSL